MQSIVDERKPWTYEFMTHTDVSEDCLFLNVWTAAKSSSEKRPVYVYIHGGANTEGSAPCPSTTVKAWRARALSSSRSTTGWACSASSRIRS